MTLDYFITTILPLIITLAIAIIAERVLTAFISRSGKVTKLPSAHLHLAKLIVRWLLVIAVVIVGAGILGMSFTNLWVAITGIVAMMLVGFFAGWSLLANVLSTLIVLMWHPFRIGDRVTILPEGITGQATDLSLFFTTLRTADGDTITVPNVTFVTRFIQVSAGQ